MKKKTLESLEQFRVSGKELVAGSNLTISDPVHDPGVIGIEPNDGPFFDTHYPPTKTHKQITVETATGTEVRCYYDTHYDTGETVIDYWCRY